MVEVSSPLPMIHNTIYHRDDFHIFFKIIFLFLVGGSYSAKMERRTNRMKMDSVQGEGLLAVTAIRRFNEIMWQSTENTIGVWNLGVLLFFDLYVVIECIERRAEVGWAEMNLKRKYPSCDLCRGKKKDNLKNFVRFSLHISWGERRGSTAFISNVESRAEL